jgi:hypothetical protein
VGAPARARQSRLSSIVPCAMRRSVGRTPAMLASRGTFPG